MRGHGAVLLLDPVLVLMHAQFPVGVDNSWAVATVVLEHRVLVLALHVVQHVALQFAALATQDALPPLEAALHDAGHVGEEGGVPLARRGVPFR